MVRRWCGDGAVRFSEGPAKGRLVFYVGTWPNTRSEILLHRKVAGDGAVMAQCGRSADAVLVQCWCSAGAVIVTTVCEMI